MIRRQDKFLNADEPAGASGQGGKGGASQGNTDFSAWDTTKKSVPGVLNAAREVRNWMNRVSLSRDDDEGLTESIISEFVFSDTEWEVTELAGGAGGRMSAGSTDTYFKAQARDTDPSKRLRLAEENILKAAELGMTYKEYLEKFVVDKRLPTLEVIRPSKRRLGDTEEQFVSTPFSYPVMSLLERVPYGTAWFGLFFEVEALEDLTLTALFTQSGQYWREKRDLVNVTLYSREGPARGFETSPEGWEVMGTADDARLTKANFTSSSNPRYSRLPLDRPLPLAAGQTRAFMVVTTDERGISLRARHASAWIPGDETDRDDCLVVRAGLLPVSEESLSHKALHEVYHPINAGAFVGVIDYEPAVPRD